MDVQRPDWNCRHRSYEGHRVAEISLDISDPGVYYVVCA